MDVLTKEQRHRNMSNTRSKNTIIELTLRKALWKRGFRYRINYRKLPGNPDIVLTKYKIAIFCDGEFYHGYNRNEGCERIGSNKNFWKMKIERNIQRDKKVNQLLKEMEWAVLRFWGNEIKRKTKDCIDIIENVIIELKVRQY